MPTTIKTQNRHLVDQLADEKRPLPPGVKPGEPVNSVGSYYAEDGTLMNADGTRSIFDDVDQ